MKLTFIQFQCSGDRVTSALESQRGASNSKETTAIGGAGLGLSAEDTPNLISPYVRVFFFEFAQFVVVALLHIENRDPHVFLIEI